MKKLLLTGFVPFLEYPVNPSQQIAEALNKEQIGEYQVIGKVLPVEFASSAQVLLQAFADIQPDAVISMGVAAGRDRITPERIAINCNDGEADNSGIRKEDSPIVEGGPAGYFSTLPIRRMVNRSKEHGIPAEISDTAGTYLCNNVMYHILHHLHQSNRQHHVPAGFIHLPASHELAIQMKRNVPSFSLETLQSAVRIMIEELSIK